jgi:hypothetical protein
MTDEEIENRFSLISSSAEQIERYRVIANEIRRAALVVNAMSDDCREKNMALTHLEQAKDWALHAVRMEVFSG